jgi:hypothetical protein
MRCAAPSNSKVEKQSHFIEENGGISRIGAVTTKGNHAGLAQRKLQKQTHYSASSKSSSDALRTTSDAGRVVTEIAKTNPLSSTFTGNRHARRRAKAMARRRT